MNAKVDEEIRKEDVAVAKRRLEAGLTAIDVVARTPRERLVRLSVAQRILEELVGAESRYTVPMAYREGYESALEALLGYVNLNITAAEGFEKAVGHGGDAPMDLRTLLFVKGAIGDIREEM